MSNLTQLMRGFLAILSLSMTFLAISPSAAFGESLRLPGTGFDLSGNPLPSGSVDPHWKLSGGFTNSDRAFFIAPDNPNWWPGYVENTNALRFQGSGWISNNASSDFNGPAPYTFSTQFDLSRFDLGSVLISGQWAIADGGILSINGHVVSDLPVTTDTNWGSMHSYSITDPSWLNSGQNTISLTVNLSDDYFEAARFEGTVTGELSPIPEPQTYALMSCGLMLLYLTLFRGRRERSNSLTPTAGLGLLGFVARQPRLISSNKLLISVLNLNLHCFKRQESLQ